MPLTSSIDLAVSATLTKVSDLAAPSATLSVKRRISLPDGIAAGKADKVFGDQRTILASANDDLDLAGGLTDEFGGVINFAKVKAIIVAAAASNVNDVKLGGAAANQFVGPFGAAAHTASVPPGGVLVLTAPAAGWAVTAATGDLLRVANSGAGSSVTYDIILIGTSA